jgi:hypothetical protein
MLHPLYALRVNGHEAEYNVHWALNAVQEFLQSLPDGEDEYFEAVRRMCSYLYERALEGSGKRYFLDKTPRYYLIIPELYRTFPQAKYIILFRNPLAVLGSILNTWVRENWCRLSRFRYDLVEAPRLLLEGARLLGGQGLIVHYERLVNDPEGEIHRICDMLGVEFVPEMIEYGRHDLPHWHFGDQQEVYRNARPDPQNVDRWVQGLADPQVWRLTSEYLGLLGREIVEQMGYSYSELQQILDTHRPNRFCLRLTLPLDGLLSRPEEYRGGTYSIRRWARSLRRRGVRGTVVTVARRVAYALSNPK